MTIEAELYDGTVLEFPDDTPAAVIQSRVKSLTASKQQVGLTRSQSREILGRASPFAAIDAAMTILNYPFAKGGEALGRGVERGAQAILPEDKRPIAVGNPPSLVPFLPTFDPIKEPVTETTPIVRPTLAPTLLGNAANIGFQLGAPGPVMKFALKPFGQLSRPPEVAKTQALAKEFDVPISAGQATQSPTLSQLESLPTRFPIGSQPIIEFGRKQTQAAEAAVSKIGSEIAKESVDVITAGEKFKEGYQLASKAARSKASEAYDLVKTAVPQNALFDTPALYKAAQEVTRETKLSKGVVVSRGEKVAAKAEKAVAPKEMPQDLAAIKAEFGDDIPGVVDMLVKKYGLDNPKRQMTFEGMDLLRKDLRDVLSLSKKDQDTRRLGKLVDGLTTDIAATAEKYPKAAKLLDEADKIYRNEVAPYFARGAFTRQLSDRDASQIVKTAIWGNRDHPENIALIKNAINSEPKFNQLVRGWWDDVIEKSVDARTDVFSIQRFLTNYGKFTPETRAVLLGENSKKADKLAELFEMIDRSKIVGANPSETARGILGATQVLGGIRIATEIPAGNLNAAIKGGVLLLSPLGMAKVLTSPKGIDLLINGFQLSPQTPAKIATLARIAALANMSSQNKKEAENQ